MKYFIEVNYAQHYKHAQKIAGDVFLLSQNSNKDRIVCTLSDGLGSGVKANVLANLTATMIQKFVLNNLNIKKSADIIMNTLPVCKERKISYSTFSICDILRSGAVKIVEYDNPEFVFFKGNRSIDIRKKVIPLPRKRFYKKEELLYSEIKMDYGDRLIFFSDGVAQSGMGNKTSPLGWRRHNVIHFITRILDENPLMSARTLCKRVTAEACRYDLLKPKDDITCAVVYVRKPRNLLLVSGPPIDQERDSMLKEKVVTFEGKKIISGGTTVNIVARELGKKVKINLKQRDPEIPPESSMEGVDLVTEGMLTLSAVARALEQRVSYEQLPNNAVKSFLQLVLNSDRVHFLVGTKINEAHQDPSIPFDIGIRRTIIKRIAYALEHVYLKEIFLEYI
jgi:serine/threonine protein phosphatase PrpC